MAIRHKPSLTRKSKWSSPCVSCYTLDRFCCCFIIIIVAIFSSSVSFLLVLFVCYLLLFYCFFSCFLFDVLGWCSSSFLFNFSYDFFHAWFSFEYYFLSSNIWAVFQDLAGNNIWVSSLTLTAVGQIIRMLKFVFGCCSGVRVKCVLCFFNLWAWALRYHI